MQIVYDDGERRRELDVRVNNPAATVADLAVALDPRLAVDDRALLVDGAAADPDLELIESGLHEGAVVRFGRGTAGPLGGPVARPYDGAWEGGALELVVVNGLDAGRRFPLASGTAVIGRIPGCDIVLHHPTVSKRHASLWLSPEGDVTITDLESHNGTWVGNEPVVAPTPVAVGIPIRVGALELEVRNVRDDDRPLALDPLRHVTAAGTIPFNRPPRPAPPPPLETLTPPQPPNTASGKTPFSMIGIITPLIFAGGMYAVMRSPMVLMFAGLTPIMGIANAVDSRRKGKKTSKAEGERFHTEMKEFKGQLAETVAAERDQREVALPDPAEVVRRVMLPSTTLWERRPAHGDFLRLRVGIGDIPWKPPVPELQRGQAAPDELRTTLQDASTLREAPVVADLSGGGVVGVVGDRDAALATARALVCQAAALHGPADLPVMVLASRAASPDWDWTKWMPHTRDSSGVTRQLAGDAELSTRLVESRLKAYASQERQVRYSGSDRAPVGPTLLVVVDDESLTEGRRAPTRSLLRGDGGLVAGIVIASTVDRLPAMCTTVVELEGPDGQAVVTLPQQGQRLEKVAACGVADDVARACARQLARFEDPELDIVGASLPASIRLLPLLELEECTPEAVLGRWKAGGIDPAPATPIGVADQGTFTIDFVADGPHGLVGGTTGAGKSELLRTMVAGLGATVDPDHLTFVLVDFKGGSAFDECARLPHTVGLVTDLDEHLAERALRCLEAELKYRERLLRNAAAIDLPDYLRNAKGTEPLPRLIVIIDEFATLKAELPDFIDSLVGVAQRGRSLGVHMLLATQRPQGAINDNIKGNTNLRIALRVQDKSDSTDVIDVPDAAQIPRTAPGRAYVRLGPNEVVAIQTALSTGARNEASLVHVDVAPFVYGPQPRPSSLAPPGSDPPDPASLIPGVETQKELTDLAVLVAAINEAFDRTGHPRPRRPWPDPLPGEVDLDQLIDQAVEAARGEPLTFVPLALADDPDAQTQYPIGWKPDEGNLIFYGIGGAGTTTGLASLALSLARLYTPDQLHLYVLDCGAGELGPLAGLPHTGAVVTVNEKERQARVIRFLRGEVNRRRDLGPALLREQPAIVLMVDGWSALLAEYSDLAGEAIMDGLTRVFADGPELGLYLVVAAERAGAVSHSLTALVRQRIAMRLADKGDYTNFGIRAHAVPAMEPGRAIVGETGQVVHVARPADGLEAAVERRRVEAGRVTRGPTPIATLPSQIRLSELAAPAQLDSRPWTIPIGIGEHDLGPAALVAYEGEHALISGPARSGKSSALLTVAAAVLGAQPDACVVALAGRRSPLATDPRMTHVVDPPSAPEQLPGLLRTDVPLLLVLIDDAETIDDQRLESLVVSQVPNWFVVAAGRNDALRSNYSHWSRALRRSKLGVLLRPDVDLDGDILGARLPRRPPVSMTVGRGYIINNTEPMLAQIALPG